MLADKTKDIHELNNTTCSKLPTFNNKKFHTKITKKNPSPQMTNYKYRSKEKKKTSRLAKNRSFYNILLHTLTLKSRIPNYAK